MLRYVHQLVTDCLCLLFGAEQVVCSSFMNAFSPKSDAYNVSDERLEQNSKVASC